MCCLCLLSFPQKGKRKALAPLYATPYPYVGIVPVMDLTRGSTVRIRVRWRSQ